MGVSIALRAGVIPGNTRFGARHLRMYFHDLFFFVASLVIEKRSTNSLDWNETSIGRQTCRSTHHKCRRTVLSTDRSHPLLLTGTQRECSVPGTFRRSDKGKRYCLGLACDPAAASPRPRGRPSHF